MIDWSELRERIRAYGIERPVYFALHHLYELFRDTIDETFLSDIRPEDTKYLDQFGMLDADDAFTWHIPFMERLFNFSRYEEVKKVLGLSLDRFVSTHAP